MQKRGQFYLVAAVVVIVIIFSIYTARNYVQTGTGDTNVQEAKYDLNYESAEVMNWGIYNNDHAVLDKVISDWVNTYVKASEDKDIDNFVFVYGDRSELTVLTFKKENVGDITVDTGGSVSLIPQYGTVVKKETHVVPDDVNTVKIEITPEINYEFELGQGKNFMFLIKKQGEVVVSQ